MSEELRTTQDKLLSLMSANSKRKIEMKEKDIQISNLTRKREGMSFVHVEKTNAEALLARTQTQLKALSVEKGRSYVKVQDLEKKMKFLEEECKLHATLKETNVQLQKQLEAARTIKEKFRKDYEFTLDVLQQEKKSWIEIELYLTDSIQTLEEKLQCSQSLEAALREELHHTQIERDSNSDLVEALRTNYFGFLADVQCLQESKELATLQEAELQIKVNEKEDHNQLTAGHYAEIEILEMELQELLNGHVSRLGACKEAGSLVSKPMVLHSF